MGVGGVCELSYCSFGYVSADVFLVIFGIEGFVFSFLGGFFYERRCLYFWEGSSLSISWVCLGLILREFFN